MHTRKKAMRRAALGYPRNIVVRITPEQRARLDSIKEKYGFRSVYEIMQYLAGAFLRVADPEHEESADPVPDEIEVMFSDFAQAEKRFEYVKPKRKLNYYELNKIQGQLSLWKE